MKERKRISAAAVLAWILAIPVNILTLYMLFWKLEGEWNLLINAAIRALPPEESDNARAALLFFGAFKLFILALWLVWAVLHLVAAGKTFTRGVRGFSFHSLLPNRQDGRANAVKKGVCLFCLGLYWGVGIFRLVTSLDFLGIGWAVPASVATLYYEWCFCVKPQKEGNVPSTSAGTSVALILMASLSVILSLLLFALPAPEEMVAYEGKNGEIVYQGIRYRAGGMASASEQGERLGYTDCWRAVYAVKGAEPGREILLHQWDGPLLYRPEE